MPLLALFVANAALMTLQLTAGRHLVPFVGDSLETWTSILAVFLAGLSLGNATAGRRTLSGAAFTAAVGAGWVVLFPQLLAMMGAASAIPFGLRVPLLAAVACGPVAVAVGQLTPLAVRQLKAERHRAAGTAFAATALGSLAGTYATGFVLVPLVPIDWLAGGAAAALAGVAVLSRRAADVSPLLSQNRVHQQRTHVRRSPVVVAFLAGFALMAVELAAVRVLSQVVGGSLFTWTGVVGVTLAGSAVGNLLGGRIDRLPLCLLAAAGSLIAAVIGFFVLAHADPFATLSLPLRVFVWAGVLFFVPALLFGTACPQAVRAGGSVPAVAAASSLGAVVGTLATGYVLVSALGMFHTLLTAAVVAAVAAGIAGGRKSTAALVGGFAVIGILVLTPDAVKIDRESNYFALRVVPAAERPGTLRLQLDRLDHSWVDPADPTFLHYRHEQVQLAALKQVRHPTPAVLVIGGGGYTFPRAARTVVPTCSVDVVEIDPEVTAISYEKLALDPALGIMPHHLDGRRFLAERATAGWYQVITLDAVNDLTVPAHLLTRECNELAKRALAADGVYLVSVIDAPPAGRLAASAAATLRQSFRFVQPVTADPTWAPGRQGVFVLAASDSPVSLPDVRPVDLGDGVVLTDRFAPVEQMLAAVYRVRKE